MSKVPKWWPAAFRDCCPGTPPFERMRWPEQAPFLTTADLAVESPDDAWPARVDGRFTLADWVSLSFSSSDCAALVIEALLSLLESRLNLHLHYYHLHEMPNGGSLRVLALAWNQLMVALGYEKVGDAREDGPAVAAATGSAVGKPAVPSSDPLGELSDLVEDILRGTAFVDGRRQQKPRTKRKGKDES